MRNFRIFAAAFFLAIPIAAQAAEPVRVDREGYRFEYIVDRQPDGSRLITGRDLRNDATFRLHVRGRKVTGEVGGRAVAFTAPRVRSEAKPTLIASKNQD